jgi:hypothetical protein
MKRLLLLVPFVVSSLALADHQGHHAQMPKEFDRLKALVGAWEGTAQMEDQTEQKVTVTYELTSGGTAVLERLAPGTPHEMVSVYHKAGKRLAMTHYCSLGNQPHMALKKAGAQSLTFDLASLTGLTSIKESHIHSLTLTMADGNSLKQEWTNWEGGRKKATAVFNFTRKAAQ